MRIARMEKKEGVLGLSIGDSFVSAAGDQPNEPSISYKLRKKINEKQPGDWVLVSNGRIAGYPVYTTFLGL